MCIVTGCIPIVDKPVFLALPYLSLNPPGREGCEKTGLPAIISRKYLSSGLARLGPSTSSITSSISSVEFTSENFPSIRSFNHGHSIPFNCEVYLSIFGAFRAIPSARTRHIPPLDLLVFTRPKSL